MVPTIFKGLSGFFKEVNTLKKFGGFNVEDEPQQLMQRFMAHQSWFDKISTGWYKQSFLMKISTIVSAVILSGVLGLLINASFFLMLSVGFLAIVTHQLLIAHEMNRRKAGLILVSESIALKEDLGKSQEFFENATQQVATIIKVIEPSVADVQVNVGAFNAASEKILHQHGVLTSLISENNKQLSMLSEQKQSLNDSYQEIIEGLKVQKGMIIEVSAAIKSVGEAATQFMVPVMKQGPENKLERFTVGDTLPGIDDFILEAMADILRNRELIASSTDSSPQFH